MTSADSVEGDDRLRLFLALQLPAATLDVLERWRREHLARGRRVPREHLHVTLAFLGGRPAARARRRSSARCATRAAAGGRIALEPVRLAGDPERRDGRPARPRRRGEPRSRDGSMGGSRRSASTVPRLGRGCRMSPCSASASVRGSTRRCPETGTFVPSDAAAYLSRLHPSGARYEVLERVSLTAGG